MKINRQLVYDKCNGKCAYCGHDISIKDMQVDHIIPQWYLTTNPPYATFEQVHCDSNLMPACRSCNNYKSGNPLESFRRELQRQPEKLRRDRPTVRLSERFGLLKFDEKPIVFYFETL